MDEEGADIVGFPRDAWSLCPALLAQSLSKCTEMLVGLGEYLMR